MNSVPAGRPDGPPRYEIRLQGHLDSRWAAWFDELTLTNENDGTTALRGTLVDQAALHGALQKVRNTGLPLISVTRLDAEQPRTPTRPPSRPRKEAT